MRNSHIRKKKIDPCHQVTLCWQVAIRTIQLQTIFKLIFDFRRTFVTVTQRLKFVFYCLQCHWSRWWLSLYQWFLAFNCVLNIYRWRWFLALMISINRSVPLTSKTVASARARLRFAILSELCCAIGFITDCGGQRRSLSAHWNTGGLGMSVAERFSCIKSARRLSLPGQV